MEYTPEFYKKIGSIVTNLFLVFISNNRHKYFNYKLLF